MKKGGASSVADVVAAGLVLAEFDIDKGSCVRAVYPTSSHANKLIEGQQSRSAHSFTDKTSLLTAFHRATADSEELACNMLPDGAEKSTLTRTVFIANRPWKGQITRFPVYHFVLARQAHNVQQTGVDSEREQTNLRLCTLSNEELCKLEWKLAEKESIITTTQHSSIGSSNKCNVNITDKSEIADDNQNSTNAYNNLFAYSHDALKQTCNLYIDAAHHVAVLHYSKRNNNSETDQEYAKAEAFNRRNYLLECIHSTIHSENVRLLTSIPHTVQQFHDKLTQDCLEKNRVLTQSKSTMEHKPTTLTNDVLLIRQLLFFVFVVVEFDSGAINGLLMHSLHYQNLIELLKAMSFTNNANSQSKKIEININWKCVADVNAEVNECKRVSSENNSEEKHEINTVNDNNSNSDTHTNNDGGEHDKLQSNVEYACNENKEIESNNFVDPELSSTSAQERATDALLPPLPPLPSQRTSTTIIENNPFNDIDHMLSEYNGEETNNIILYGLCAVVSKQNASSRRGGVTKSIAVLGTSLSLLEPFWSILVQATQYCCDVPHTDSDAIEQQCNVLKLCYRTINSISARVHAAKGEINPLRYQVMSLCTLNRCNAAEVIYRDAPFGSTVRASVPVLAAAHEITLTHYNLERLVSEFGVYFVHLLYAVLTEQRIVILSRAQQQQQQQQQQHQQQHLTEVCEVALSLGVIGSMLHPRFIPEKVFPYASVNNASAFMHVPGYIAGTVNPIFADEARWNWDVLCDLDHHTVSFARSAKRTKKIMKVTAALANALKMGESAVELLGALGSNVYTATNRSSSSNNNNNTYEKNKGTKENDYDMTPSNKCTVERTTSSSSSPSSCPTCSAEIHECNANSVQRPAVTNNNAINASSENSTQSESKEDNIENDVDVTVNTLHGNNIHAVAMVDADSIDIYSSSYESAVLHKELVYTIYHMRATQVAMPDRHRRLQLKLEEFVQITTLLSVSDIGVDSIIMSLLQPTFGTAVMITLQLQMQLCSFMSHAQAHILFRNEPLMLPLCCAALRRCNGDLVDKLLHILNLLVSLLDCDEAVLWLLRRMPSALDGLNPIAVHLTHSTFAVRLAALTLLKRIEQVPEGKAAMAAMSSFLVIIYENCMHQRGANTNVENYNNKQSCSNNSINNDNNNNNLTVTNDCNARVYIKSNI